MSRLPRPAQRIVALEREERALDLARQGASPTAIARSLGYFDSTGANKAIARGLKRLERQGRLAAGRMRHTQFEALQSYKLRLHQELLPRARYGPTGEPRVDPVSGKPLMSFPSRRDIREVIRTLVKVAEREARLMGLNLEVRRDLDALPDTPIGDAFDPLTGIETVIIDLPRVPEEDDELRQPGRPS